MAIVDFHCENISDRVVESTCFKQIWEKSKYVGSDINVPQKKKMVMRNI